METLHSACIETAVEIGDLSIATRRWQKGKISGEEFLEALRIANYNGVVQAVSRITGFDFDGLWDVIKARQ